MLMGTDRYTVTESELGNVPTPRSTKTHHPIPHGEFAAEVERVIFDSGYDITEKEYAVFRGGDRMLGILAVAPGRLREWKRNALKNLGTTESNGRYTSTETALFSEADEEWEETTSEINSRDYRMTVGLRNSHDKSFAAGLVLGTHVIICSNGMFFGDASFQTMHTPKIMERLPGLIIDSFARILPMQKRMDQAIEIYKNHRTQDTEVHDFLIKSVDRGVIPNSYIPKILGEYRTPGHEEFITRMEHSDRVIRTGWTLMNSYSEILKKANPLTLPRRTITLHKMLDELCGVPSLN